MTGLDVERVLLRVMVAEQHLDALLTGRADIGGYERAVIELVKVMVADIRDLAEHPTT